MLVVTELRVGVDIDDLHLPLDILERDLFILLLLRIHFLFALLLAGRRAFLVLLLQLFAVLFRELLDLPALTRDVVHRVMHQASGVAVITTGHLMGVLDASWAFAPTHCHSCSCGCTSQRLAIAANLLLLVVLVVVVAVLSSGPTIALAILACLRGR
jgi:hypothetical protein